MSRPVLASCSDTIKLWELPNTSPTKTFNPHSKSVTSLSWSANNQVLVSGSSDGSLSVSLRGAQVLSLEGHGMGPINSVSCSISSRLLAAGDENGYVHVWELKNRDLLKSFKVSQLSQDSSATCVQFNASDSHIAAGSSGGEIVLYSMTTNQTVANFQVPDGKESGVRDLKYSPFNRNILAACSDDGGIHMWDTHTRKLHTTFPHQHGAPASALAFSPANKLLLSSCGLDKKILFYDVADRKVLKIINTDAPLNCLSFMEDGITLAAGSTQGKIFVYDLRSGSTPTHILKAHEPFPVNSIQFQHPSSSSNGSSRSSAPTPASSISATHVPAAPASTSIATVPSTYPSIQKLDTLMTDSSTVPSSVVTNGTSKTTPTPSYISDVAAFSPIKGAKGGSAPPATPSQTRDEQHREIMLKAQRVLQQPVPNLPSGLSTKSLQALQQADETSKSRPSSANGLRTGSDIFAAQKQSTVTSIQVSPPATPVSPIPLLSTSTSKMTPTEPRMNPQTITQTTTQTITTLASTYPGPRASSTPNVHSSIPASIIGLASPIFPSTPSQGANSNNNDNTIPHTPPVPYSTFNQLPPPHAKSLDTQIHHPSSLSHIEPDHIPPPTPTTTSSITTTAPVPMDTSADHHSEQPPQLPPSTSPPPQRTVSPAHTTTTTSGRAASPVHTPSFGHTNSSTYTIPPTSAHAAGTPPMPAIIPIHDVQRQLIKSVLDESLAEFKGAIRQDVQNLHLELIRQFQLQQLEMRDMLELYVQNSQRELVEEIKALRQENNILRQRVFY